MKLTKLKSSSGFTIVELMIALTVLSVILVIGTVIMIQIGSLYSKGVNAANLQSTARNIASDVTAAIQFSTQAPSPCTITPTTCFANPINAADTEPRIYTTGGVTVSVNAFCIGSVRYSYVMNRELGNDPSLPTNTQTPHVLWRDTVQQSAPCQPLNLSAQTIPADTSSVDPPGPSRGFEMVGEHMRLTRFRIQQAPSNSGVYNVDSWLAFGDSDLLTVNAGGQANCNSGRGSQFCATVQITTDVAGRVY
jgi:prepilin-type N-terminal cleavage/methylation domain-containing protein